MPGGLVYIAGEDGHVHTLDAGSGRPRWRARRGEPNPNPYFPPLPPVLAGDTLAVTASFGGSGWADAVLGLAAADGAQRWTYPLVGTTVTGLAADDSDVVVTGRDSLTCLDPADGQVRWTVPPPTAAAGPWQASFDQPAVDDDHVYAIARFSRPNTAADGGYLIMAFDRSTGTEVWSVQVDGGGGATLTVGGDLACVGDSQGRFIVLRRDTGDTAWWVQAQPKLGLPIRSGLLPITSPGQAVTYAGLKVDLPVIAEQEIYVPSRNGDIHC